MFVYQTVFHVTPVRAARPRHGSLHLVLLVGCSGHRWGMVVTWAVCFGTVFLEFVRIIDRFCVKNHLKYPQIINFHGIFHYKPSILKYNYTSGSPDRWRWRERERELYLWQSYVSTIFLAIFCGDIPLHRPSTRPKIDGRYLQSRILKWPLKCGLQGG